MIQRPTAPPRGPRGSPSGVQGGGRGGIQKRRAGGPIRVDKDGDLDMDASGRGKSGKGRLESPIPSRPQRPQPPGRGRASAPRGNSLGMQKAQQAILRGLGAKQANVLDSRNNTGGTTLQVDGLKSSKAASNTDGGLESLLGFLERKAAGLDSGSNRTVRIKKVCFLI
jgi:nuclear RNA export factor